MGSKSERLAMTVSRLLPNVWAKAARACTEPATSTTPVARARFLALR